MPRRNYPKSSQAKHRSAQIQINLPGDACRRKRRFATKKIAQDELDLRELMQMSLRLGIYNCIYCNGWHLTSYEP